ATANVRCAQARFGLEHAGAVAEVTGGHPGVERGAAVDRRVDRDANRGAQRIAVARIGDDAFRAEEHEAAGGLVDAAAAIGERAAARRELYQPRRTSRPASAGGTAANPAVRPQRRRAAGGARHTQPARKSTPNSQERGGFAARAAITDGAGGTDRPVDGMARSGSRRTAPKL